MKFAAAVLLLGAAARLGVAQCPDGTPAPCDRAPGPPANPRSVAVLYFDNLSRDSTATFLADGLTEELIVRLGQVQRLEVKSRFESLRVRGRPLSDPRALGRALHAAYLVTGGLQLLGDQVRLSVSLVRAAGGAQVWGNVYDRAGADLLAIQSEIAREVATAVTGRLLPAERATLARRPTRDPVAYDLYLRGVGAANTISEAGLRAGLDYFARAIARDSSFADAHAQQAYAWNMLADGYVEGRVGAAHAREAAERALRHDPSEALAYAVLAFSTLALDYDAARAESLARRAVRLARREPLGHSALAAALLLGGRTDEVAVEARRGFEADTLSATGAWLYLWMLNNTGRFDSLAAVLPRMGGVLAVEDLAAFEGLLRLERGDASGAAQRLSWTYYGGMVAGGLVTALIQLGRKEAAAAVVDSMERSAAHGYFNAYGIAAAHAALGDADGAFLWLDRAYDQRTIWLAGLATDREFASLRGDARWAPVLRRMRIAS